MMKVPRGGELDVENLEGEETYLRTRRINIRDNTKIIFHGRTKGTKNAY